MISIHDLTDHEYPVFIIAEAGVNHNGSLKLAKKLVDVAVEAGADAVKFQTFKTDRLVIRDSPKAAYQQETTGSEGSQYQMLKQLELGRADHLELIKYCRQKNIMFLSTPFDFESADLLDEIGVPVFKVGSGDLTNLPLLEHIALKGKPMIVSTGMSGLSEVEAAVNIITGTGNKDLILLHCVSNYPADFKDVNLRAMSTLKKAFGVPVGYSDHTPGIEVSIAAVALGARVIEKHFTLDKSMEGPDHRASLDPAELKQLVQSIRNVEKALGDGIKRCQNSEQDVRKVARKSLVARRKIKAGEQLTLENVTIKRPETGIKPGKLNSLIGKARAKKDIEFDTVIRWEDIIIE